MKNKFFIYLVLLVGFSACQEIPPLVGISDDTIDPTEDQQKKVLVEEYTGVQCVNCPEGAAIIKGLKQQYSSRLIPIAVHAGDFAFPISESNQILFTGQTNAFMNFVGAPLFYPAAAVNRIQFDGQTGIIIGKDDWPAKVAEQLNEELMVEVYLTATYDVSDRSASVTVDLNPLASLNYDDLILTVVLLEDDINEAQVTPSGVDVDYVQEHVLRDFFTPTSGESIDPLVVGASISRDYSLTVSNDFVAEHCQIVAFLSRGGADKEVFQVNAEYLVE